MRRPLAKLAGFGCVLAIIGAGSALAGTRLDVHPGERAPEKPAGMGAMAEGGHGEAMEAQPVRGLAVSDRGLTLALDRTRAPRGERFRLALRILDRRGATVRDFDVEHTKRMHLIVVRRDMTGFQHLHPVQRADGSWAVPATLREAGSYRVFADFSAGGGPHTLAADLTVDGTVHARDLPTPARTATVDGLQVRLDGGGSHGDGESELAFTVTRHGRPVAIQDYLGAKGHLVALREGDLAFLHVHPDRDRLRFMATFPTAGRYRLFLQFRTGGRVHTAAFTKAVAR